MAATSELTIRTKIILIAMICSVTSLLTAVLFSDMYERYQSKSQMREELSAIATILGERSTAALQFGDNDLANKNLAALKNIESVIRGCMYKENNGLFASYHASHHNSVPCPPESSSTNTKPEESQVQIKKTIMLDGQKIGTLNIIASLTRLNQLLAVYFLIHLGFAAIAGFIALLLASRMQRFITEPISQLTNTAAEIEASKDYHLRAKVSSNDEIGNLANAFNNMLERIETDNQMLKNSEERFRTLTTSSPFGVFQVDNNGNFIYVNQRWRDLTDIQNDPVTISSFARALHPEDRFFTLNLLKETMKTLINFKSEFRFLHSSGKVVTVICEAKPVFSHTGEPSGYLGSLANVSELKSMQRKMEKLALYDSLTELPNRRLFRNRLEKAIQISERSHVKFAVLFLDFDHFKKINDSLGHDQGDELLIIMARRLQLCTRKADTISRLGGDEFTILIPEIKSRQEVDHIATKLISSLRKPIRLKGQQITVTCSIGITIYPDDAQDANTLLKNADLAMYKAKDEGRNLYHYFSEDMNHQIKKQLKIENDLRKALERQEFELYFQPKKNLANEKLVGYEALIRWSHPDLGTIEPDEFIPVAEDVGLIIPIGQWVLSNACEQIHTLLQTGKIDQDSRIAINLSAKQFHAPNLVKDVGKILAQTRINPKYLELEITESLLMDDIDAAIATLRQLRMIGISLSIDDFGTGYSSFNYLKRLPIDAIKIDRSFVADIPEDKDDMEIVSAIIAMAHKLRLTVIAEGVETPEQKEFLCRNDCDVVQGYFIGMPRPATELPQAYKKFGQSSQMN